MSSTNPRGVSVLKNRPVLSREDVNSAIDLIVSTEPTIDPEKLRRLYVMGDANTIQTCCQFATNAARKLILSLDGIVLANLNKRIMEWVGYTVLANSALNWEPRLKSGDPIAIFHGRDHCVGVVIAFDPSLRVYHLQAMNRDRSDNVRILRFSAPEEAVMMPDDYSLAFPAVKLNVRGY